MTKRKMTWFRLHTHINQFLNNMNYLQQERQGFCIMEATGLVVTRYQSGPLGGDQEIGAMIAKNDLDMVIFFRDPLTAQPHEPDVNALLRLCDVYAIPLATNMASAEMLMHALERGDLDYRKLRK